MGTKAAITVNRPREEVQGLWQSPELRPAYLGRVDARVIFRDAPGDRGTEIHVDLGKDVPGGRFGRIVQGVITAVPLAKAKDDLRRFKQRIETGEVPRSDATPEGESLQRKLKQRPAQPLKPEERQKVGV